METLDCERGLNQRQLHSRMSKDNLFLYVIGSDTTSVIMYPISDVSSIVPFLPCH